MQQTFHGIENIRSLLPILRCIVLRIHKGGLLYQEDDIAGLNGAGLVIRIRQIGFDLRCNLPRFRSAVVKSVFHCGGDMLLGVCGFVVLSPSANAEAGKRASIMENTKR